MAGRAEKNLAEGLREPAGRSDDGPRKKKSPGATTPAATPMMAQFIEIKAANPDSLLFYRMGDFYEMFFEDAVTASQVLGIALTKRGKHLGEDIPMCGVPVHAAEDYLHRLIARGFRVAVCEQMEDPAEAKKRGAKSVVRRDVVRLVTPGTITEDNLLESAANNFLTALFPAPQGRSGGEEDQFALASLDISTGEFVVAEVQKTDLAGEIARLSPSEILIADKYAAEPWLTALIDTDKAALAPVPASYFDSLGGEQALKAHLRVKEWQGFGDFSRGELAAIGGLLKYVELTQIGQRPAIRPPQRQGPQNVMVIDAATRANLEIIRSLRGEKQNSLLHAIDRTVTGAGSRELAARLASPLTDVDKIAARQDAVAFCLDEAVMREDLRRALRSAPDIARALARLTLGRGSPRDLGAIRDGLHAAARTAGALEAAAGVMGLPDLLKRTADDLKAAEGPLERELATALADELPVNKRDGGFIRAGYSDELDDMRLLRDDSRKVLAALQTEYAAETDIKSLKVKHNNVLGFFIEVTSLNGRTLMEPPHAEKFIHRQTLASAMRFSTEKLGETERQITSAADRALAIEQEVFADLLIRITEQQQTLGAIASALAGLDHTCALAVIAEEQDFVRPRVDDSLIFAIRGGRHPVVEQALGRADGGPFIENDCTLGVAPKSYAQGESGRKNGFDEEGVWAERLWILTGPNMAGKSTFLRQNALIALMAQTGSFVPARSAHIGVIDRLFSRVGASDDLARGRSTFMVEMVETASILNQATERSLVILDEIGRGTATYDGLSIAWATVEYLHEANRCRALFATHYHELTALTAKLDHVSNATIEVKEWKDEIIFLHKVVPGAADRSYGIQVAKLAGLPATVIERAGQVLAALENSSDRASPDDIAAELPLFAAARPKSVAPAMGGNPELEDALSHVNPDELTPRQALEALYDLKRLLADSANQEEQ